MTKAETFKGKGVEIPRLYASTKKMLENDRFRVIKDEATESVYHLKAERTGVTQIVIGAARDVELVIAGDPDAFAVVLSVGAWGKNISFSGTAGYVVASVAGGPAMAFGTIAATGSYVRAITFENDLWKRLLNEVNKLAKNP